MPDQNRPLSRKDAPDPARTYERAKPEAEGGMGRLENDQALPSDSPDRPHEAVGHRQDPTRQINGQDDPKQPDHSMHDEEPDGWDQAPTDIRDPKMKRHPRTEGRGGTP
jgi:hypothetical protein